MTGMGARLGKILVLGVLALAVTASGGSAARPADAPILGVIPHVGQLPPGPHLLSKAVGAASPSALSFDASYESLINRYFTDVAHDSGGTNNVYSAATQYYDTPGPVQIQYQSTFGGSYVAKDPLPANGCDDGVDTYCLTDRQLQDEIQTVLTANGWHGGLGRTFFLMTPNGVGSCFDSGGLECTTNAFCAYHSDFVDSSSEDVIYANEPYMGPPGGCTDPSQGFPNDPDSDTTINTISHEHNEAITDPFGNGWVAADGVTENGDLCAYGFGTPITGTPGVDAYNQVINGHHYELQEEYSNQDNGGNNGCVQKLGGPSSPPPPGDGTGPLVYHGGPVMHTNTTYAIYWLPTPGNASRPVITGTAAVNKTLTSTAGSWNGSPTSEAYQWQRCSSIAAGCVNIPGATRSRYTLTSADGQAYVRSTVSAMNVNGSSAYVASTAKLVVTSPQVTKAPRISGQPRLGRPLSASHGSWTGPPTAYRYQWLRCNGRGGSCSRISRATRSTYRLATRDAGHRLRVRVTATNAAGDGTATSRATARVPAAKH